jgi:hypothetical protein
MDLCTRGDGTVTAQAHILQDGVTVHKDKAISEKKLPRFSMGHVDPRSNAAE